MAESSSQRFWKVSERIGTILGLGGVVVTAIAYLLAAPTGFLIFAGGLSVGILLLVLTSHFILSVTQPLELGGIFQGEAIPSRRVLEVSEKPQSPTPPSTLPERPDDYYERKQLKPNLVERAPEIVLAREDDYRVIVKITGGYRDNFPTLVLPFTNTSRKEKVAPLERSVFQIDYQCYVGEEASTFAIPRGSWLSEKDTEVDFPANCLPRNAILATIEGEEKTVYSIRRDDSSHQGVITTREELRGTVFGVRVTLLAPSVIGAVKKCSYILEIIRNEDVKLRLSPVTSWKSEHLSNFLKEGYDFLTKLHEIWKDAYEQVPFPPPVDTGQGFFRNYALNKSDTREPFDYDGATARVRAIEREQEGELLDAIKEWETKAADFVKVYFGAEQGEQFIKSVPSFDEGFDRAKRPVNRFKLLARNAESKDVPPEFLTGRCPMPLGFERTQLSSWIDQLWKAAFALGRFLLRQFLVLKIRRSK